MREVELKKIPSSDTSPGYDYSVMIKAIIENPGKRPYGVSEMRQAVNLLGKIDKADGTLLLEQSEYAFLRDRLDSTEFLAANQELLDFIDTIQLAPEVEVKKADDAAETAS